MRDVRVPGRAVIAAVAALIVAAPAPAAMSVNVAHAQSIPQVSTPADGVLRILAYGCMFDADKILDPESLIVSSALPTDGIYKLIDGSHATFTAPSGPNLQDYFREVSHGRIRRVEPTFAGWHSIGGVTDGTTAEWNCYQSAVGDGYDPPAYGATVLLLSRDIGDHNHYHPAWVDPSQPADWVFLRADGGHGGWTAMATWAHEIGHRLGLPHSSTNGPRHTDPEYTNPYDAMSGFDQTSQTFYPFETAWCVGGINDGFSLADASSPFTLLNCESPTASARGVPVHYSAYQENRLGWLLGRTTTHSAGTRSYFIERLAQPHDNGEALMVSVDSRTSTKYYTIEARRRIGYDAGLPGEGIIFHKIDPSQEPSTDRSRPDPVGLIGPATLVCCNPRGPDTAQANAAFQPGDVYAPEPSIRISVDSYVDDATHNGYWVTARVVEVPTILSVQPGSTKVGAGDTRVALRAENYDSTSLVTVNDEKVLTKDASLGVTIPGVYASRPSVVLLRLSNGTDLNDPQHAVSTHSNYAPFFITSSGVQVLAADAGAPGTAALAPAGTVVAETSGSTNRLYAQATGTKGVLSVGRFSDNPIPANSRTVNGGYIAAAVGQGENFTTLAIDDCALGAGSTIYWWNGKDWVPVSNQTATTSGGCRRLTLDNSTSVPRITDLDPIGFFATGPR